MSAHGSAERYKNGCHCDRCRAGNARKSRVFRAGTGGTEPIPWQRTPTYEMWDCTPTRSELMAMRGDG